MPCLLLDVFFSIFVQPGLPSPEAELPITYLLLDWCLASLHPVHTPGFSSKLPFTPSLPHPSDRQPSPALAGAEYPPESERCLWFALPLLSDSCPFLDGFLYAQVVTQWLWHCIVWTLGLLQALVCPSSSPEPLCSPSPACVQLSPSRTCSWSPPRPVNGLPLGPPPGQGRAGPAVVHTDAV